MKIALISDIHANLPALESVLASTKLAEADHIYHLGDLVGYAPWPNETVALIRQRAIQGVAGNYDSTVGTDYKHCGCKYEDPEQERLSHISYEWTRANVTLETKTFLRELPFRLDVRPRGGHQGGPKLILVHGSPTMNTLYWTEDRDDDFCSRMAEIAGAKDGDVIAFGHTHLPWKRTVNGIQFVNTGSVGRPKDKDARAGFTLVTFDDAVSVEHVRVAYDVEKTAQAIIRSDLPDFFAEYLRTGGAAKTTESA